MTILLLFFSLPGTPNPTLQVRLTRPVESQSASMSAGPQRNQIGKPDGGAKVVKRRPSTIRKRSLRKPDVIYYPTPDETVTEMLRLAEIRQDDVLYDLGSGDGRIPIMAAQQYGIRAVGIEIDPKMVTIAEERARGANVDGLVSFRNADMFRSNISEASVVTLYLSNKLNLLLRPKLLSQLRPGSRVLSHDFHMGDWEAERTIRVPWQKGLFRTIYLWRVPVHGTKSRARRPM